MTDEKVKRHKGCLFYGCLASSLLLAVVLVAALIGLRYAKKMFTDFTDTQPLVLPQVQLSPTEMDSLQRRLETFRETVRKGEPTGPLTLTQDEINALIATDPDMKPLKGKLYVLLEGSELKAQVSLPMDQLGLPVFQGRYLNGTGTFDLAFHNGVIRLSPRSFVVKGKPVPDVYMDKARKQNLASDMNQDARAKAAMERLQEIKVQENKLMIVPK